MKKSAVIPEDAKDLFWQVVTDCLIEFHGKPRSASRAKARQFRRKVEEYPAQALELFYHGEPFDIACRIAGNRIKIEKHVKRYIQIRDVEHPLQTEG